MWIRSQNKLVLVDSKRVQILTPNIYRKKYEIVNYVAARPSGDQDSFEDYDILGEYDTKERAIEILNSIQEQIINLQPADKCQCEVVYKIPKE